MQARPGQRRLGRTSVGTFPGTDISKIKGGEFLSSQRGWKVRKARKGVLRPQMSSDN